MSAVRSEANELFDPSGPPRPKRRLRLGEPQTHAFSASDGVGLRLTRYQGGRRGPVLVAHCIGVSSRMYTTDTVETNLAEFLYEEGFDVWLLDFRLSIELPASREQSSLDDVATKDYPAAVSRIRQVTGADTVQVVAHGVGSSTFTMAMLSGLEGVRAAVCSQVSTHIKVPTLRWVAAGVPPLLSALGVRTVTTYVDRDATKLERALNRLLALQPVEAEERCGNPVCHRITGLFGPLYEHDRLSRETHTSLHELFGIVNLTALRQLALLSRRGHLVDAAGENRYLTHLGRLAIPIAYIHGEENDCVLPESTEVTRELLSATNGDHLYRRHVIPAYGHVDCMLGRNAARDVFPLIAEHLRACL